MYDLGLQNLFDASRYIDASDYSEFVILVKAQYAIVRY